jgi:hypothetical protein
MYYIVTFKDLKKRVAIEQAQQQSRLFERLQNKPFWIWNKEGHKQEDIKTNVLIILLVYLKKMEVIRRSMTMRR